MAWFLSGEWHELRQDRARGVPPWISDASNRARQYHGQYALKFSVNPMIIRRFAPDGDKSKASLAQTFAAGCTSGALTTTLTYPSEVIKARITVAEQGEYKNIYDCVKQTAREGKSQPLGIMHPFYRGYGVSLMGSLPYNGTQLGLNAYLREELSNIAGRRQGNRTSLPISNQASLLISLLSSFAAIIVSYPFNLARTKLQTQGVNGRTVLYDGTIDCFRKTLRHEGVTGLYRGFVPNCMKALPAQIIALEVVARVSVALS